MFPLQVQNRKVELDDQLLNFVVKSLEINEQHKVKLQS
jgi:hypothetical protein